jgi:hypothetical protein
VRSADSKGANDQKQSFRTLWQRAHPAPIQSMIVNISSKKNPFCRKGNPDSEAERCEMADPLERPTAERGVEEASYASSKKTGFGFQSKKTVAGLI